MDNGEAVKLIELYENRPLLHNTKEKQYRDRDMQSKALAEIANALDIPGRPFHYKLYTSHLVLNNFSTVRTLSLKLADYGNLLAFFNSCRS